MAWIQKYKFRFELWPQPEDFDDNWSVSQRHTHGWLLDEAKEHGVPVSGRLYGGLPHVKQFTDLRDVQQPFPGGRLVLGHSRLPRLPETFVVFKTEPPLYGASGAGRGEHVRGPSRDRKLDDALW